MVDYQHRLLAPGGAGVLEVPDQFPVLAVDAHDGQARLGEGLAHGCDVGELGVAAGVFLAVELLRVRPEPVAEALQELGDGVGADLDAGRAQLVGDLLGGAPASS